MNKKHLKPIPLSKQSGIPLYYQMKEKIKELIGNGYFKPGDILPPENELTKVFGVSRAVARRALSELILEGLVESKKGIGSFVTERKLVRRLQVFKSFTKDLKSLSPDAYTSVIRNEIVSLDLNIQNVLNLPPGSKMVLVERIGYIDDLPFAVIRGYYPLDVGKFLLDIDLANKSIYKLLSEHQNIRPKRAEKLLYITPASYDLAVLLDIRESLSLMCLAGPSYDQNDALLEYSEIYHCGNMIAYAITTFRNEIQ